VGKLRPAYGGTQVATLRVSKEMARKMLQTKNVKVGLNSCSIRERVDIRMCYKCWGYDHHASECREEDKKNQCRKCGEEGHHSGECKNDAYCIKCNRAGHAAGSTQCKAFKDALKKRQMEAKKMDDRKTQGSTHVPDRRTSNAEGANDPNSVSTRDSTQGQDWLAVSQAPAQPKEGTQETRSGNKAPASKMERGRGKIIEKKKGQKVNIKILQVEPN
jgi:hypothetical protein